MYYIYVLRSRADRGLYIGFTQNVRRRFREHEIGKNVATRTRGPFKLVYLEGFIDKFDALRRERYMKTTKGRAMLKSILKEYLSKTSA